MYDRDMMSTLAGQVTVFIQSTSTHTSLTLSTSCAGFQYFTREHDLVNQVHELEKINNVTTQGLRTDGCSVQYCHFVCVVINKYYLINALFYIHKCFIRQRKNIRTLCIMKVYAHF